jgi:methionyl-tRNA synthetase
VRVAKELGTDVLRYQLLRAIAFGQDGDFDHAAMLERYNADLGKNLGNLLSRTLGLCAKMTGGKTPKMGEPGPLERELFAAAERAYAEAAREWETIQPHRALEATWALSSAANGYVDRAAPWTEAKNGNQARVETILATLLDALGALSVLVWPVMPVKSDEMRRDLGLPKVAPKLGLDLWPASFVARSAGEPLTQPSPLFPTLDKDKEAEILARLVPKATASREAAPPAAVAPSAAGASPLVTYDQFAAVDLRVGIVRTCERVPRKDKLLQLKVDLGEKEERQIVAGLAQTFKPEDLVGKKVVVVANLAPRDFGKGLVSHGMLLATGPSDALHLATVDGDAAAGARLK